MKVPIDQISNRDQFLGRTYEGEEAEKIRRLMDSIGSDGSGLLHPISLVSEGNHLKLLAGGKRLVAFHQRGLSEIPAIIIDLNGRSERGVTLAENLIRYNLPWWEEVELVSEYHKLKQIEAGVPEREVGKLGAGRPKGGGKVWSLRDTADALGRSLGGISEDVKLAQALKSNPSLAKVKDRDTALRLVRQTTKRIEMEEEQAAPPDFEMNQVFNGDSLHVLAQLPPEIFDVCITDPPWLEYKDEKLIADTSTIPVFKEVFRVLKPTGLLYLICSTADWYQYYRTLQTYGFRVQKYPLYWVKTKTITHGRRPWEYARDVEPMILAAKGEPVLAIATELSSVFTFDNVHSSKLTHPHEKPLPLIEEILRHSTWEGAKVLDPFAGSGVVLDACKQKGRYYVGIERDRKFYEQIIRRLEDK